MMVAASQYPVFSTILISNFEFISDFDYFGDLGFMFQLLKNSLPSSGLSMSMAPSWHVSWQQ
jgi:hypothetical protein